MHMSIVTPERFPTAANLDFWVANNYNVLINGLHGVGKTETVRELFNRHFNGNWRYFSAPTMDPWVDFVGVPRERTDPITGATYLDMLRSKEFEDDTVEALFFDEINRAPPKVLNAIMELIQFKSINGRKFKNLKMIWAARNPEGDDYAVETLDRAHEDRFHIHVFFPYAVSIPFFTKRYGTMGQVACDWWNRLDDEKKLEVSPRRLEVALDVFSKGGDIEYVLPFDTNIQELCQLLFTGNPEEKLLSFYSNNDISSAKEFMESENNYYVCKEYLFKYDDVFLFYFPLMPKHRMVSMFLNESPSIRKKITKSFNISDFGDTFLPLVSQYNKGGSIDNEIKRWVKKSGISDKSIHLEFVCNPLYNESYFNTLRDMKNGTKEELKKFIDETIMNLAMFTKHHQDTEELSKEDFTKIAIFIVDFNISYHKLTNDVCDYGKSMLKYINAKFDGSIFDILSEGSIKYGTRNHGKDHEAFIESAKNIGVVE